MQLLRQEVERVLKREGLDASLVERPPRPEMGDLAFPCFELAKKRKSNPAGLASDIALKLRPTGVLGKIAAMGPYVNFYADWERLGELVLKQALKENEKYGSSSRQKKKIMVEFAHPNTHKTFHIGHLRNITLGESLSRILDFAGNDVIRANYQGDIGPHVARCLWGILHLGLKEPKENKGKWLGDIYAAMGKKAADPKVDAGIRQINRDLYAGKPDILKLWQKTRKWSLDYFDGIYKDFGVRFDRLYFESEVEKPGVKLAKKLLDEKTAKLSDGAIIMDLEEYGLGIFVLLSQDGTPLYSIKDFILADLQEKEFKPDRIVHIVGSEQDLYFRQLFKSLETVNPDVARKEHHLSYSLVNLESGKMSSREGNVILYEDLRERLLGVAGKLTKKKNPKLKKKEMEAIAGIVAMGALRYEMIKVSPEKTIVFDWVRALSFEGNNAPYLQYTHARCCSISRKSGLEEISNFDANVLLEDREIKLIKKVSEFPEIVEKSAKEMRPHYIATYAYELCDAFNEFYQFVPVINSEERLRKARLALVSAVRITLRNALRLLGIEAPESM